MFGIDDDEEEEGEEEEEEDDDARLEKYNRRVRRELERRALSSEL